MQLVPGDGGVKEISIGTSVIDNVAQVKWGSGGGHIAVDVDSKFACGYESTGGFQTCGLEVPRGGSAVADIDVEAVWCSVLKSLIL